MGSIQHIKNAFRGLLLVSMGATWLGGLIFSYYLNIDPFLELCGAGVCFIVLVLFFQNIRLRIACLLLLCLSLGMCRYSQALPSNDALSLNHIPLLDNSPLLYRLRGTVTNEPELSGKARTFVVAVTAIEIINISKKVRWQSVHGNVAVTTLGETMEDLYGANYGDNVELQGKLRPPPLHYTRSINATMLFPRIHITGSSGNVIMIFLYHARVRLKSIIEQVLPQPAAALMIAIVLGLRTPALHPLIPAFNITGTAHLIVPSGFKLTILASLLARTLQWLTVRFFPHFQRLQPAAQRQHWLHWLTIAILILAIGMYTVISGAGPAAIRAGIMGCLLILAPRMGRQYTIYTALSLAAFIMTCLDPFIISDAGFQLSFLGTLGIVLLTPLCQKPLQWIAKIPGGALINETVAVTLAAQIATVPIFILAFQQLSFIAPITNLLTVPLLSTFMLLGILICSCGLFFWPLAIFWGWIAWPLLWYMIMIVQWCAHIPMASLFIDTFSDLLGWSYYLLLGSVLIGLFLAGFYPQKEPFIVAKKHSHTLPAKIKWLVYSGGILLIISTTIFQIYNTPINNALTITFMAVGPAGGVAQGEAILIHTAGPASHTILIDGGIDAASLAQQLDSRLPPWQHFLDVVVLTSSEQPHLTGLLDVVARYSVGLVIDAGMLHPTTMYAHWRHIIDERNLHYRTATQGSMVPLATDVTLKVLWPPQQLHSGSQEVHDNSMISQLLAPGFQMLLLGASSQSHYALTGLLNSTNINALRTPLMQMDGDIPIKGPAVLATLLQTVHPSLLVLTPPTHPKKQSPVALHSSLKPLTFTNQVVSISQTGTLEISSDRSGWDIHS